MVGLTAVAVHPTEEIATGTRIIGGLLHIRVGRCLLIDLTVEIWKQFGLILVLLEGELTEGILTVLGELALI